MQIIPDHCLVRQERNSASKYRESREWKRERAKVEVEEQRGGVGLKKKERESKV